MTANGAVMIDDDAMPAPFRCEAITTSGARCMNHGYTRRGRRGRVCNTHKNAARLISKEQVREEVEQYMAHRTPQEKAVLSAMDRAEGQLWAKKIVEAMTDSERELFTSWDEVGMAINRLHEKRALRLRHEERFGAMVTFILRNPRPKGKVERDDASGTWRIVKGNEVLASGFVSSEAAESWFPDVHNEVAH